MELTRNLVAGTAPENTSDVPHDCEQALAGRGNRFAFAPTPSAGTAGCSPDALKKAVNFDDGQALFWGTFGCSSRLNMEASDLEPQSDLKVPVGQSDDFLIWSSSRSLNRSS